MPNQNTILLGRIRCHMKRIGDQEPKSSASRRGLLPMFCCLSSPPVVFSANRVAKALRENLKILCQDFISVVALLSLLHEMIISLLYSHLDVEIIAKMRLTKKSLVFKCIISPIDRPLLIQRIVFWWLVFLCDESVVKFVFSGGSHVFFCAPGVTTIFKTTKQRFLQHALHGECAQTQCSHRY
jgi:hypothetical protein